jgi:hypothetical protein
MSTEEDAGRIAFHCSDEIYKCVLDSTLEIRALPALDMQGLYLSVPAHLKVTSDIYELKMIGARILNWAFSKYQDIHFAFNAKSSYTNMTSGHRAVHVLEAVIDVIFDTPDNVTPEDAVPVLYELMAGTTLIKIYIPKFALDSNVGSSKDTRDISFGAIFLANAPIKGNKELYVRGMNFIGCISNFDASIYTPLSASSPFVGGLTLQGVLIPKVVHVEITKVEGVHGKRLQLGKSYNNRFGPLIDVLKRALIKKQFTELVEERVKQLISGPGCEIINTNRK